MGTNVASILAKIYLLYRSGHAKHSIKNYVVGELKRYIRSNTKEVNFMGLKIKFYERLRDRGFIKWKLTCLFHKVKLSDRANLLLPKNSCEKYKFQMIPEHLVRSGVLELDRLQLAEAIDASLIEGPTEISNQNMLMVENGATGTLPEDIYRHYFDTIVPATSNVQFSSTLSKRLQQLKKQLCLFLPGWLACIKKSLDSILRKNLSYLFLNKKFYDMFLDYNICIVFKNDHSIKNLIVKTKL